MKTCAGYTVTAVGAWIGPVSSPAVKGAVKLGIDPFGRFIVVLDTIGVVENVSWGGGIKISLII